MLNIVGLGVGKWINNLGGIGTMVAALTLVGLGIVVWLRFGTTVTSADFHIPPNPRFVLNSFGVICFGLVGLELASVMGDEIRDPERTLPGLAGRDEGALPDAQRHASAAVSEAMYQVRGLLRKARSQSGLGEARLPSPK